MDRRRNAAFWEVSIQSKNLLSGKFPELKLTKTSMYFFISSYNSLRIATPLSHMLPHFLGVCDD